MINLILKEKPEDFYVEEILDKDYFISCESNIYLYKITKTNLSHKELELLLKTKFHKMFYFCGMKDKNAITVQYITSHEKIDNFDIKNKDYELKLEFMNSTKKHLFTGANKENYFEIKTNKFKDIKTIQYIGIANYFDEQRFGNVEYLDLTLAVLNNDFEKALKIYLTRKSNNNETNIIREELFKIWPKVNKLPEKIKEQIFERNEHKKNIYNYILKNEFEKAFNELNKKDLQFYYKQFQSKLWNDLLKTIISKYKNTEYENLYYALDKIPDFELALPNAKAKYNKYNKEFKEVLEKYNLKQEQLNKIVPEKTEYRNTIFFPKNISQKESIIKFKIPKGSYATILIKQLYCMNF